MKTNETQQNTFTDEEKQLAERYQVEPKLCRLISDIVSEHTEGMQSEQQEEESQQADEETEFQKKRFNDCVVDIRKAVSQYPVENRPEVLAAALHQASRGATAVEKIDAMESQVCEACDSLLNASAKAVLVALNEISSVYGISSAGDYGTQFLLGKYHDRKYVDEARKQNPDIPELAVIAEAFDLANSIMSIEVEG